MSRRQSPAAGREQSVMRRFARLAARRLAVLAALLILFYATSLHGVGLRTFILAGILLLFLYWVFKDAL